MALAAEDNKLEDEDDEEHTAEETSTEDSTPPSKEFFESSLATHINNVCGQHLLIPVLELMSSQCNW